MSQELTTQQDKSVATRSNRDETAPMFTPAVDIFEVGDTTTIVADLPGVAPDAVDVTLERRILTIRGHVGHSAPEGYRRLTSEYREGAYERVFTLSDEVDQSKIKAEMKNGVLRLDLPRTAETKPKKIDVKAA